MSSINTNRCTIDSMPKRPPDLVPGPADERGAFVLIDEPDDTEKAATTRDALAEGSDVHDVDDLEARLAAESGIDSVLRDYLEDPRDIPALPPLPQPGDRRRR